VEVVDVVEIFTENYDDNVSMYIFGKLSTIIIFEIFTLPIVRFDYPSSKFSYPLTTHLQNLATH
jgi:hypothetical protein